MIDPSKITNFNLSDVELEEMVIFWLMVAGKTAKTTAKMLDGFLNHLHETYEEPTLCPFKVIGLYDKDKGSNLEALLKTHGFGCQKAKAKGIRQLISSNLNLKTCPINHLENIHGIGMKTSRCFVMHTRKDARHAGLDTHVLKWLRDLGYDAPKATPSKKQYLAFEKVFVDIADILSMPIATLDLAIWNAYSTGGSYEIDSSYIPKLPDYKRAA